MLIKRSLVLMGEFIPEMTVKDAKRYCVADFYQKTYNLFFWLEHSENTFNKEKLGLQNYSIFQSQFAKQITLNSDNIVYEEDITKINDNQLIDDGIINWFENHRKEDVSDTDNKQDEIYEPTGYLCEECSENTYDKVDKYFKEHATETFGKGEFPFLMFKIYKIGNHNYYGYGITR